MTQEERWQRQTPAREGPEFSSSLSHSAHASPLHTENTSHRREHCPLAHISDIYMYIYPESTDMMYTDMDAYRHGHSMSFIIHDKQASRDA